MKRRLVLCLCLILLLTTPLLPALADQPKVIDEAGLLSSGEISLLEDKAQRLADTYEIDVVILTVNSLGGKSSQNYADDYYDENGYGIGDDDSGVLFLIAMDSRDWYISTCGDGIYALTDYGIQELFSDISWDLSNGYYYDAFDGFLNGLVPYFEALRQGTPIDGNREEYTGPGSYEPGTKEETIHYPQERDGRKIPLILLGSGAIGLIVAAITLFAMRSQMNTTKRQTGAGSYLVSGSYDLTRRQDIFLYSHVNRTRRADTNNGGSRGGGSSVHHSSGGSRHGGGGGKF